MKAYQTKAGITQYKPSYAELEEAFGNSTGFCVACGEESSEETEPDMKRGLCESCGAYKVYGAEELMLMNLFHQV